MISHAAGSGCAALGDPGTARTDPTKQILCRRSWISSATQYFPACRAAFNSPLSRAGKDRPLAGSCRAHVAAERLREWSKQRREDRPEAYSNTSTESIEPLAVGCCGKSESAPSVPPASPPPVPPGPVTLKAEVPASLVAQAQPTGQLEIKQATGEGAGLPSRPRPLRFRSASVLCWPTATS